MKYTTWKSFLEGGIKMSNKAYDILKWIAMYLLPALGTLYFALAGIVMILAGAFLLFINGPRR
jgi:hypothetical protein